MKDGFNLPHRANVDEIIRVKGYDSIFLVTARYEEVSYRREGMAECVSYDCINVDNSRDMIIVFDEDVDSIVVKAEDSEDFMKGRESKAKPPMIKPPEFTLGMMEAFQQITRGDDEEPKKTALSAHEKKRAERKETQAYVDYLIDTYALLATLEEEIGGDETRQEEMQIIRAEFDAKSDELRGGE